MVCCHMHAVLVFLTADGAFRAVFRADGADRAGGIRIVLSEC